MMSLAHAYFIRRWMVAQPGRSQGHEKTLACVFDSWFRYAGVRIIFAAGSGTDSGYTSYSDGSAYDCNLGADSGSGEECEISISVSRRATNGAIDEWRVPKHHRCFVAELHVH